VLRRQTAQLVFMPGHGLSVTIRAVWLLHELPVSGASFEQACAMFDSNAGGTERADRDIMIATTGVCET